MASLETAFEQVAILAEDFKNNEKYYIQPEYSEAQARKDFIDKFFIALGWDVNHEDQKDPYKQEVKVERGVYVRGAQRRADYSFSIAPNYRDPKFFVEAKKPSRQLENADDYFQAVRYGWNTQNPLVVLTDFEEFHILDSRFKPDIKSIINYCHQKYHYSEYLDKEKFKKIYYLFSREAVENSSIENYVKELPKPKGKKGIPAPAVKSFDQAFLDELDETRESLARAFKRNNNDLTSEELTEATQRVIDRLVFIRFLEDKLIEGEHHISGYGSKKTTAWQDFIKDCRTLDAKYNGIVFKKHFIDETPATSLGRTNGATSPPFAKGGTSEANGGSEHVFNPPEDKDFAGICDDFSHVNSPYDFNFIPIHILGSIYERFLGKVVHATAKQVRVEEKPEVRKAGGVYYTPQYIVKYIVDNTVGKILQIPLGRTNGASSPPFAKGGTERSEGGFGLTPKQISKLRFADISCGSGSFLITVFDTLLDYHGTWYQSHPKEAKADGCILKDGMWVLSLHQKREILLNNIYGVDIDYQAVEVTQLSLFLKLLEDETLATAYEMQTLFKERILPDLSKNIVCGNSLIGRDIFEGELFSNVEPPSAAPMVRPLPPLAKGGSELDEKKINAMNFEDRFPHIFKTPLGRTNGATSPPFNKGGTDARLRNGQEVREDSQGFDAIVGNPPWGQKAVEFSDKERKYFKTHYPASTEGILDLFRFFIEKSFKLLIDKGCFGYVLPDIILLKNYDFTRKLILDTLKINLIDHWGMAFEKVNIDTCSIIGEKLFFKNKNRISIRIHIKEDRVKINQIDQTKFHELPGFKFNLYYNDKIDSILKHLNNFQKMGDLFEIHEGIHSGNIREKLFLNKKINSSCKKLIFGRDEIKQYVLKWNGKWVDYRKDIIDKKNGDYAGLGKKEYFETKKIVVRRTGDYVLAAIDFDQYYFSNNVFVCIPNTNLKYDLYYILGILNSKFMTWYYRTIQPRKGKIFSELKINQLKTFPIPNIDLSNKYDVELYNKLINYVKKIIELKLLLGNINTDKDINFYNNHLDSLFNDVNKTIYHLFNFSIEEINEIQKSQT